MEGGKGKVIREKKAAKRLKDRIEEGNEEGVAAPEGWYLLSVEQRRWLLSFQRILRYFWPPLSHSQARDCVPDNGLLSSRWREVVVVALSIALKTDRSRVLY